MVLPSHGEAFPSPGDTVCPLLYTNYGNIPDSLLLSQSCAVLDLLESQPLSTEVLKFMPFAVGFVS